MKQLLLSLILLFSTSVLFSQKINTDSLLVVTQEYYKNNNWQKAKELSQFALQIEPKYDDFNLILGQIFTKENQTNQAKNCLETVITNNPKYKEAYIALVNLHLQNQELIQANRVINDALIYFPNDSELLSLKSTLKIQENSQNSIKSDWLGTQYTFTQFNRENVGPWHLLNLHYKIERAKLTSIVEVNYFNRNNTGSSNNEGIQYELNQYLKHTPKNYSFWNLGYSNDIVFPKFKAGYSFFHNLKSYEFEVGARYTNVAHQDIFGSTIGIGKYYKNFWFNLKNNLFFFNSNVYDSYRFTTRYYYNTKYDYVSFLLGTGSSPDDRVIQGSLNQRAGLKSYNGALGFSKIWSDKFLTSVQINYNKQEYSPELFQNEWGINVNLDYKF